MTNGCPAGGLDSPDVAGIVIYQVMEILADCIIGIMTYQVTDIVIDYVVGVWKLS